MALKIDKSINVVYKKVNLKRNRTEEIYNTNMNDNTMRKLKRLRVSNNFNKPNPKTIEKKLNDNIEEHVNNLNKKITNCDKKIKKINEKTNLILKLLDDIKNSFLKNEKLYAELTWYKEHYEYISMEHEKLLKKKKTTREYNYLI